MGLKITRGGYADPGTSLAFDTGSWRVQRPLHRHTAAPCHGVCPAGEDAQAYLALVQQDRFREAWETIARVNPLPGITGRVCHHPCESACNRGQYDEPIAIHDVERYLGDRAIAEGWAYPVNAPAAGAAEIAVVGAGPAGLAAAYHLTRLGYRAQLYEALPEAGGLLRSAIPHYRLPVATLDGEIERLLDSGIVFNPGQRLGRNFSLAELQAQYPAVFLGPGTQRSREWNIDGATPGDLHVGLDLLKAWMDVGSVPDWKSVAIVGAGNTAIDLARVLKFAGVPEVHIISHKAIPGPGVPAEDSMPAILREIRQGIEEGVVIHEHRGVQRLILRGQKVVAVELVHMKKLANAQGRMKRVAFEGTESLLNVDHVIPAIGQTVDPAGLESVLSRASFLRADDRGSIEGHAGVFTGGDARGDHGTVSEAVGDGRRAALAIDAFIKGETGLPATGGAQLLGYESLNLNYFTPAPRPHGPTLEVAQRTCSEEIDGGLDQQQVLGEGRRCFSCGNCLACDNCWTLCPDVAVLKTRDIAADGSHYVFDYGYCKGCGLCSYECPTGYIAMEPET
jgi:NADPH-dependent glutamate synthase beta subunit-like oxidoreductase/ferredoxin